MVQVPPSSPGGVVRLVEMVQRGSVPL